jgi:enterobactin synthetase component D / holo-[acyl-carrier protein] synthase
VDLADRLVAAVWSVRAELCRVESLGREAPGIRWDRLLFCAKECVYKAWFPLARRWLDFTEADIELRPDGTFAARLLVPGPSTPGGAVLTGFAGRWLVEDGLVVTAIT